MTWENRSARDDGEHMAEAPTIFALSSAPGRAGVAVVRVSGPRAGDVIDALAPPRPKKRMAALRRIRDPASGETLDEGLVLWFAAPRSETGEDMAEFHLHGGSAIVKAVLAALARQPGCRLAEPGEFAGRAFANGKIDLAEAEGLADLIDAETDAQRRQALSQMGGALSELYEGWRTELIRASALVEAVIDFSDEADVASEAFGLARGLVERLQEAIAQHLDDNNRGEILREGFRVVLAGAPNVGKSSLLNALARREAAIVSDTAGIREPQGSIEREGIRRTLAHAREADLVVWLSDASAVDAAPPPPELAARGDKFLLIASNKTDVPSARVAPGAMAVSAKSGAGIEALTRRLEDIARDRIGVSASPAITRARYRHQLQACLLDLQAFLGGVSSDFELRAEDLRQAAHALGRITGRVDVEDVLGEIFSRFCIGK